MEFRKSKLFVAVSLGLALAGCGGDDDHLPALDATDSGAQAGGNPDATVRYYVLATDDKGYVNVITDTGTGTTRHALAVPVGTEPAAEDQHADAAMNVQPARSDEEPHGIQLGEVIINDHGTHEVVSGDPDHAGHKVFVVIRSGMTDAMGMPAGGGFGVIDLNLLMARDATAPAVHLQSLASIVGGAGASSVLGHVVPEVRADGTSSHFWIMNDGPTADDHADAATQAAAALPDSVFRVNWDHHDEHDEDDVQLSDDRYLAAQEIAVGDGHKMAVVAAVSDTHNFVFVHNANDRTVSVINNVPVSPDFQKVAATIDLGEGNIPHGIAFSKSSGHVYVGIPNSQTAGLMVIDATVEPHDMSAKFIPVGTGAGQLPGSEHLTVSSNGRWVFVAGYTEPQEGAVGSGFLSVIDASVGDAITQVKHLGDIKPARIDAVSINVQDAEMLRLFVSSQVGGAEDAVVAVVDVDPATGLAGEVSALDVGHGGHQRQVALSADNRRIYFSVEGSCAAHAEEEGHDDAMGAVATAAEGHAEAEAAEAPHAECGTIVGVDVLTKTIDAPIKTIGSAVNGMAVYVVPDVASPSTTPNSGSTSGGSTDSSGSTGGGHTDDGHSH